jgi:transcriptional regulator with XRE-family HTH domain
MEPTSLSRAHDQLVSELRRLREAKGLSGQALGDVFDWSQSKVSKIENGRTKPSVEDVTEWARHCGANEKTTSDLATLADAVANEVRPWSARHGSLADRTREVGEIEAATTSLRNFQPAVIPGLLQTADYARRVVTLLDVVGDRDIKETVARRMNRQPVLYDQAKTFEFVLTEGSLRWRPGPKSLMLAQLDKLITIATLPNVSVGVLPFSHEAVGLYTNGFTIFEMPDETQVLVETMTDEQWLKTNARAAEIPIYAQMHQRLSDAALKDADATQFIRALMTDLGVD